MLQSRDGHVAFLQRGHIRHAADPSLKKVLHHDTNPIAKRFCFRDNLIPGVAVVLARALAHALDGVRERGALFVDENERFELVHRHSLAFAIRPRESGL